MVGGQIALTYQVDNFPGFPEGLSGPELTRLMRMHAERFGAEFIEDKATTVDFSTRPLKVYMGDEEYQGETVIVAMGSVNRKLGLKSEERLMGRGVFVCATCDAALYEGKRVVVVGGGDSAVQEALDLAKFAREVVIVHRRSELSACLCLKNRALENERIRFVWNTVVEEILGESRVEGVRLRDLETGEERVLQCDGVLIAIGWIPNTSLFQGQLDLDEQGYIVSETGTDTSVDGVFVGGDIIDKKYRQVVTACGSGCKAALDAERYIDKLRSGA
jgi:thioredoxin reductase (NADPH)